MMLAAALRWYYVHAVYVQSLHEIHGNKSKTSGVEIGFRFPLFLFLFPEEHGAFLVSQCEFFSELIDSSSRNVQSASNLNIYF